VNNKEAQADPWDQTNTEPVQSAAGMPPTLLQQPGSFLLIQERNRFLKEHYWRHTKVQILCLRYVKGQRTRNFGM